MSSPIQINVEGMAAAQRAMAQYPEKIAGILGDAITEAVFIVSGEAKKAVTAGPTRALLTGRLRASIGGGSFSGGSFAAGTGTMISGIKGTVMPTVNYALDVHEGLGRHKRKGPRRFMDVARQTSEDKVRAAFEYHIGKITA